LPLAIYEQSIRREPASAWYRVQVQQAVQFGIRSAAIAAAALVWPLIASLLVANATLTIAIYAIAVILDCALAAAWVRHAVIYYAAAARGDTFSLQPLWRRPPGSISAKP
jgi:hypothetical protein